MSFIVWQDKYSVNIAQIDKQHQKMVSIINRLFEAMKAGKGNQILGDILEELIAYTRYHFHAEEQLMERYRYPQLLQHRQEHKQLIDQVNGFYEQFRQGKANFSVKLSQFLKDWLIDHIQGTDRQYSIHLNNHGVF